MAEMTYEELKAKLDELQKEVLCDNETGLKFKLAPKGGASVYGLGRWPTTLYYEQWMKILDHADELRKFLETNQTKLKKQTGAAEQTA